MCLFDECVDNCFGVFAFHSNEHQIACVAFDQCRDLAVVAATDKIAFPVTRYRSVRDFRRPFTDRHRINDATMIRRLLRVMA